MGGEEAGGDEDDPEDDPREAGRQAERHPADHHQQPGPQHEAPPQPIGQRAGDG